MEIIIQIYFSGGEPVLDQHLCNYIAKAAEYRMCTMILSNGTLIDYEKALELRRNGLNIVQISLEGLEQTHDFIRGKGTFQKATAGLDNCHRAGLKTTAMVTLSKLNIDEIEGIIKHCINNQVTRLAFGRLVPTGNGADLKDQMLTKKETLALFKKIKKLRKKYCRYIYFSFNDPLWLNYFKVKENYGCSAGIRGICITEYGDFMPCRRLNLAIGNIRETSLLEIWNSDIIRHYRERDIYEGKCGNCKKLKNCGGCRAIAKATNGFEFSEDPQCFL